MEAAAKEVLKDPELFRFRMERHYKLRKLLKWKGNPCRYPSGLTNEERRYARNRLTHVDFLFYAEEGSLTAGNLVLEVDGAGFHQKESRQADRDRLKDSICERYGIPLERFRTTGHGEKKRLEKALREALPTEQDRRGKS
ncbi:MAG: DUF2726 domain-containing protein [Clostridium sp.]|jgi:hypothetical protein|nr:DUF2726 domain-containing protein [Clostridium sp.]